MEEETREEDKNRDYKSGNPNPCPDQERIRIPPVTQ